MTSSISNNFSMPIDALVNLSSAINYNEAKKILNNDPAKALTLFQQILVDSSTSKDLFIQVKFDMAEIYRKGMGNIQKDWTKALELYEEIINASNSVPSMLAKYHRAGMWTTGGHGIEENLTKAQDYFYEFIYDQSMDPLLILQAKYSLAGIVYNLNKDIVTAFNFLEEICSTNDLDHIYDDIKKAAAELERQLVIKTKPIDIIEIAKKIPQNQSQKALDIFHEIINSSIDPSIIQRAELEKGIILVKDPSNFSKALKIFERIIKKPLSYENQLAAEMSKAFAILNYSSQTPFWSDAFQIYKKITNSYDIMDVARQTYAEALLGEAECYEKGKGTSQNTDQAIKSYQTVISEYRESKDPKDSITEDTFVRAATNLAKLYRDKKTNLKEACKLYSEVIDNEKVFLKERLLAAYDMAELLIDGGEGVEKNEPKAREFLLKIISFDHPYSEITIKAMFCYANILIEDSSDKTKNRKLALKLFSQIIDHPNATKSDTLRAQYYKASVMYQEDTG